MTNKEFLGKHVFPAAILLGAAFWCGAQKSLFFALTGFLGCFLIAVSLLIEGWKKLKNTGKPQKNL